MRLPERFQVLRYAYLLCRAAARTAATKSSSRCRCYPSTHAEHTTRSVWLTTRNTSRKRHTKAISTAPTTFSIGWTFRFLARIKSLVGRPVPLKRTDIPPFDCPRRELVLLYGRYVIIGCALMSRFGSEIVNLGKLRRNSGCAYFGWEHQCLHNPWPRTPLFSSGGAPVDCPIWMLRA